MARNAAHEGDNDAVRLQFHNPRTEDLRLVLEPWGEVCLIRPGTTVYLVGEGPRSDGPEITCDQHVITVWGWAGSVLHIVQDGIDPDRAANTRPAVPSMSAAVIESSTPN